MKKWLVIVLILLLFVVVSAALIPVKIDSPGATGMNSNFDIQEIRPTDAVYLENGELVETPGMYKKRKGLGFRGGNAIRIYGAAGYYEPTRFHKLLTGVTQMPNTNSTDSLLLYDSSAAHAHAGGSGRHWHFDDTSIFLLSPSDDSTLLGVLRTSDTFAYSVDVSKPIASSGFPKIFLDYSLVENYQDFVSFNEVIIHTDGSGQPSTYHTQYKPTEDSSFFSPRSMPMSLEAPGQPRVQLIDYNCATCPDEPVEYTYGYEQYDDNSSELGDTGFHSIIVYPKNQAVLIYGFMPRPYRITDTVFVDSGAGGIEKRPSGTFPDTRIRLYKRRVLRDPPSTWARVKAFTMKAGSPAAILDTGINEVAPFEAFKFRFSDSIPAPGEPWVFGVDETGDEIGLPGGGTSGAFFDSLYRVRYAWYDPVRDIEGPMGPISRDTNLVYEQADNDTSVSLWTIGNVTTDIAPAPWIRVYQNVAADEFLHNNDTTLWYLVYQAPVDRDTTLEAGAVNNEAQSLFALGFLPDTAVAAGWEFQDYDTTYFSDNHYDNDNYALAEDGSVVTRPPYIDPNTITFTDMEYANGRLWGIGDPLFPARLYFSGIEDMNEWSAIDFLALSETENDEIVALEVIPSGTGQLLYALKRLSVYLITGRDLQYDLEVRKIYARTGAVDRRSTISFEGVIYYLGTDMKIYQIIGTEVSEISQPIENFLDTFFTDFASALDSVNAYPFMDKICWTHTRSGKTITYQPRYKQWQVVSYHASFIPVGSFYYDTSSNRRGFSSSDNLLFESDSASEFRVEVSHFTDSVPGDSANYLGAIQSPFIGDGEWLYQFNSVDIMGDWDNGDTLKIFIVDSRGVKIDSAKVVSDNRGNRQYRVGFPPHIGSYLALRFESGTLTDTLSLHSYTGYYRRVGKNAVN